MSNATKHAARLIAGLIAVVATAGALPADATASPYTGWRFRSPNICVQDNLRSTSMGVGRAAAQWNVTKINFVVRGYNGCASVPDNQKVRVYFYSANDGQCASVVTWMNGGYVAKMNLRVNLASKTCWTTNAQRQAVMAHELGHAGGLGHRAVCASIESTICQGVMRPQSGDLAWMNQRWSTTVGLK